MSSSKTNQFFDKKNANSYDKSFDKLRAINDNLHLLIRLILKDLPSNAHILCVGVGTGEEIIALSSAFPSWHFTGVDPSSDMLHVCQEKLNANNLAGRVRLIEGYVSDVIDVSFDAVLCLLVSHFVMDKKERQDMYNEMAARLIINGYLINSDICFDQNSPIYPNILKQWKNMHEYKGASKESLIAMDKILVENVSVLPPEVIENFHVNAGLTDPVQFFQALLIRAWYSRKI